MYSIGEFSKINKITPKTLRHYDRIGLLKPARIDDWTGYRYYDAAQLPLIRRILSLKDMGFALTDIQGILEGESAIEPLLERRVKDLEAEVTDSRRKLERARGALDRWRGGSMKEEIRIKALQEVIVASMRTVVPNYDAYFEVVPRMGEYMKSVGAECREPGYCFTIYHDGEYREADIDVEICEAVVEAKADSDAVVFKTITGVEQAACLHHRGPYATLGESYNRLFSWIEDQGWKPAGMPRESYIDGIWNQDDPEDWLTEIQVPMKREDK